MMDIPRGASVSKRADLLEDLSLAAARAWTADWVASLAGEGRVVEGGWPGTMSDARARTAAHAARVLRAHALPALGHEELETLTRATYKEAQRLWRTRGPAPRPTRSR